ncbi:hypothetical protein DFJ74DRAFT_134712 [Hyaloraphidium curvatum]|nr:hypothetical protein DFJ74DRAFT_134712 [Hyaloraphidium curvatum]
MRGSEAAWDGAAGTAKHTRSGTREVSSGDRGRLRDISAEETDSEPAGAGPLIAAECVGNWLACSRGRRRNRRAPKAPAVTRHPLGTVAAPAIYPACVASQVEASPNGVPRRPPGPERHRTDLSSRAFPGSTPRKQLLSWNSATGTSPLGSLLHCLMIDLLHRGRGSGAFRRGASRWTWSRRPARGIRRSRHGSFRMSPQAAA